MCLKLYLSVKVHHYVELKGCLFSVKKSTGVSLKANSSVWEPMIALAVVEDIWRKRDLSVSLYVPYPMMWAIMDFHSSLSLAFSNSATSWYLTPLSPIPAFKFAIQSDHFLPLLLFPSIFLSVPDSPNHLFSSNVPETSSALFLFLRLVSCLFQLFSKPLHFLLCLSKEFSSFISKTTFHSFPNTFSYQMLLTKFHFHI